MAPRLRFPAALRRLLGRPPAGSDGGTADERGGADSGPDGAAVERAARRLKYSPETSDADVATVLDALEGSDREAAVLAVRTLAGLPSSSLPAATEAVGPLVGFLDDDLGVRIAAARAVGRLGAADPSAVVAEAPRIAAYLDDFRVRVSNHAAAALAAAARSSPGTVAPLVFEYVDGDRRYVTWRNAVRVVGSAARADPGTVAPVVSALVALLDEPGASPLALVETLAVLAEDYPDAVAGGVPALVACASERSGAVADAAVLALAELGVARPAAARPAVPALTDYLAGEDAEHDRAAADALVAIAAAHPEERDRIVHALADAGAADRLRAARTLAATDTDVGRTVAERAVGDSRLDRYLPTDDS